MTIPRPLEGSGDLSYSGGEEMRSSCPEGVNLSLSAMLKLISLNVERSKHLSRNIPFFLAEQPDVLCLQEAFEADLERIQRELSLPFLIWLPDVFIDNETNSTGKPGYSGQAIFSRLPLTDAGKAYYYMPKQGITLEMKQMADVRSTNAQGIIWASVKKDGETFTIANTHFTWTPDGYPNTHQEVDFASLKVILSGLSSHILVGDLNAPRGRGIWEKFSALYNQDNIPAEIKSTVDPDWHHFPHLVHVVDCLFTDSAYMATGVRIVSGLSDHRAVVAGIRRSEPMI